MGVEELLEGLVVEGVAALLPIDGQQRHRAAIVQVDHGPTVVGVRRRPCPYARNACSPLRTARWTPSCDTPPFWVQPWCCASRWAAPACAGGDESDSASEVQDDVSEQLQSGDDGYSADVADCYAGIIVDEIGAEELQDVDLTSDDPPPDLQDEIATAAERAVDECDLEDLSG